MIITENILVTMLASHGALVHTRSFSNISNLNVNNIKYKIFVFTGYDSIINLFINQILPYIKNPFTLVLIESDIININSVILEHHLLKHIYSWNVTIKHPKITCIPIGLNYNRQYISFDDFRKNKSIKSFNEKKQMILVNFSPNTNPERSALYEYGKNHWNKYATFIPRIPFIKSYKIPSYIEGELNIDVSNPLFYSIANDYRFILSPPGAGLDCHRHWEALALGCIPIMITSPLDPLFDDLPVCIINSWEDINEELLDNISQNMLKGNYKHKMEKLTLEYWIERIVNT